MEVGYSYFFSQVMTRKSFKSAKSLLAIYENNRASIYQPPVEGFG